MRELDFVLTAAAVGMQERTNDYLIYLASVGLALPKPVFAALHRQSGELLGCTDCPCFKAGQKGKKLQ